MQVSPEGKDGHRSQPLKVGGGEKVGRWIDLEHGEKTVCCQSAVFR